MTLQIHIRGPSLDLRRDISDADGEVVLGRDADCDVCLPDPERNVSRRHLSIWADAEYLRFRVDSVVNGVDVPAGEIPPGAVGVLAIGEVMMVGDYALVCSLPASQTGYREPVQVAPEAAADPFGDWDFGMAPVGGDPDRTTPAQMPVAVTDGVQALFRGLGLDPAALGPLSAGELEDMGRLARTAVEALLAQYGLRFEFAHQPRSDDRTMLAPKETNLLAMDIPMEAKLLYLFGGRAAAAGQIRPERALAGILARLAAHDEAVTQATGAALQGALREFGPQAIKSRADASRKKPVSAKAATTDKTKLSFLEKSRLWDTHTSEHAQHSASVSQWVEQMLERYYRPEYQRRLRSRTLE